MDIVKVCKNVGWDGESFFCMRCYRAGFATKAQAVGHQSQCRANEISLGYTTTQDTKLPPPPSAPLPPPPELYTTTSSTLPPSDQLSFFERQLILFGQQVSEIKQEQVKLANETAHELAVKNQNPLANVDWRKVIAWGIGIAVVAFLIGRETKVCHCGVEAPKSGSSRGKSLGSSVASKVKDKVINSGINWFLK